MKILVCLFKLTNNKELVKGFYIVQDSQDFHVLWNTGILYFVSWPTEQMQNGVANSLLNGQSGQVINQARNTTLRGHLPTHHLYVQWEYMSCKRGNV